MEDLDLQITTHGGVGEADKDYVVEKISRLGPLMPGPVLYAKVKLFEESNPALERSSIAEASVDMNGRILRAHVAARSMSEAVDLLEERLRRQLANLNERFKTRKRRPPSQPPGEWRHGDAPSRRAERFERPVESRELVRRKTFAVEPITVDEAAFDMEMLDHDFYLFTNAETGYDSVIHRLGDGRYEVQGEKLQPAEDAARHAVEVVLNGGEPPRLDEESAIDRLGQTGELFLYFIDSALGRGNVIYHRYDGHYGLITPAE